MIISMAKSSENYPAISQKIKLQKTDKDKGVCDDAESEESS